MGAETPEKTTDYDRVVEFLDKYEAGLGLKEWQDTSIVNETMELKAEQLSHMTAEQCGERAFQLLQYCTFLQRKINFEDSIINWANSKMELVIADKVSKYGGVGKTFINYDEKRMAAIKDDDAAHRLYILKVAAENRLKRLNYLPRRIEAMANSLIELQLTKRKKEYERN